MIVLRFLLYNFTSCITESCIIDKLSVFSERGCVIVHSPNWCLKLTFIYMKLFQIFSWVHICEIEYLLTCRWNFSCWDMHLAFRLKWFSLQCFSAVTLLHAICVRASVAWTIFVSLSRRTMNTVCWLHELIYSFVLCYTVFHILSYY